MGKLNKLLGIAMIIIGVIIFAFFIKKIGVSDFLEIIKNINFLWILIALFLWIIHLLLVVYRFKSFMGIKKELSYYHVFKTYLQGFLLNYASAIQGIGIGAKIVLFKAHDIPVSKTSSSLTLEIIYDLAFSALFSLVFILFFRKSFLSYFDSSIKSIVIILIVLAAIIFIYVLLKKKLTFLKEYFSHIKEHLIHKRNFTKATWLTIASWIIVLLVNFFVVMALGEIINPFIILGGLTIGMIIGMISFIPGGLGVREGVYGYVYSLSGVALNITLASAIVSRIISVGSVLLLLIIFEIVEKIKKLS